jgi:pilus assembly protein CpaE
MESVRRVGERGQASVEFVAALPFVLLFAAVVWQCALAGHTLLAAAHAARAAARAELVAVDGKAAARSALPVGLRRGLVVRRAGEAVRVSVPVPLLTGRWQTPLRVSAAASLGDEGR